MKKNYSIFFLLLFLSFLVGDTFSNVNSNSFTSNEFNPHSYLDRYETYNKVYQLVCYNRSFDHSISLRGPPVTLS